MFEKHNLCHNIFSKKHILWQQIAKKYCIAGDILKNINNLFTRTLREVLFKNNGKREQLLESLRKKDSSQLKTLWDKTLLLKNVRKKYKLNSTHCFKINVFPLSNDLNIITIYIPYAIDAKDYILVSFIDNVPERMFFCGIELSKEKVVVDYKKNNNIVNCFCVWTDRFFHYKVLTISNEFNLFDIYMNLYLDYIKEKDELYIPIKEDIDSISYFFVNSAATTINSDCFLFDKKAEDLQLLVFNFFHLSMQIAIKKGESRITTETIANSLDVIEKKSGWLKHNSKAFYSSKIVQDIINMDDRVSICKFCKLLLADYKFNYCFLDLYNKRYCYES